MIDLDYFEGRRPEAERVLAAISALVSGLTGRESRMRLLPHLDQASRERVLRLNEEVFGREGEVFDRRGLAEVEADPDALFLVLEIDGRVEGCVFGYYEEPGQETVQDADFFIDTAMVSRGWQSKGVGQLGGFAVLLLVGLLGDVRRVGVAVWSEGDVESLLSLYRRFGFVDGTALRTPHRCMTAPTDQEHMLGWRAVLGLPAPAEQRA